MVGRVVGAVKKMLDVNKVGDDENIASVVVRNTLNIRSCCIVTLSPR